jgi:hypothetical protein
LTSARIGEALDAPARRILRRRSEFRRRDFTRDRVALLRCRFANAARPLLLHADPAGAGVSLAFAAWAA